MRILNPQAFGGGINRAQTPSFIVATTTGLLGSVSAYGLLAPQVWARTGGNANLTINTATGAISATAALAAGASQTLIGTVSGADGVVVPFTATLTGVYPIPTISGTPPATGAVGVPYTFTPTITGSALTIWLSGTLPLGLSFNSSTGAITGTPTTTQTAGGLVIAVSNTGGTVSIGPFSITIPAASARPTNAIRNSTNTGYVRSISGGYATMGAPVYV